MKRFLVAAMAVSALLAGAVAFAGNTQVGSTLRATGTPGTSVAVATASSRIGIGYRDTFPYGAAKGITQLDQSGGGACAANTTTVPCMATFGSGVKLAWAPIVTATLELAQVASGLDISGDLVDNDGNELFGGVLGASGRPFIIGDDPAFYFCTTVKITDADGTDDFHVGFRRPEAVNAVFDNYLDLASIGVVGSSNPNTIQIETILNNAATTTTDTTQTWADAATKTLCVGVGATGAAAYSIDGSAPTVTAAFTFDDGDPVIPFMHLLHNTNVAESTIVSLWQVGFCGPDNAATFPDSSVYTAKTVCDAVQ
jgi:hypothetical protein